MSRLHPHAGARRAARLVVIAALLGGVLALLPVPRLVAVAAAMETETRSPTVVPGGSGGHPGRPRRPRCPRPAGSTASEEGLAGFVMIGATTDGDGEALARVRTRGRWGEWFELHHSADHGPDAGSPEAASAAAVGSTSASEPVWVGEADAYELRLPEGVDDVEVHLVREGDREVGITADEPAGSAPAIRPRSSWGARPPSEGPYYAGDLHMAVVHHSAGANSYTAAQVPSIIRAMQAYHMDANGWYDLAYNFVVDRFGVVWEGRGGGTNRAVVGGHAAGFNTGTTGVVVMGDLTSTTPRTAAVNAVGEVIAWKFAVHGIDPSSTVPFTTIGSTPGRPAPTRSRGSSATATSGPPAVPGLGSTPSSRRSATASRPATAPTHPSSRGRCSGRPGRRRPGRGDPLPARRARPTSSGVPGPRAPWSRPPLSVGGTYRPVVGRLRRRWPRGRLLARHRAARPTTSGTARRAARSPRSPSTSAGAFTPFVGDFDGNGADDIYWFAPGLAPDAIWYGNANRVRHSVNRSVTQTAPPFVGDFDGDEPRRHLLVLPGLHARRAVVRAARPHLPGRQPVDDRAHVRAGGRRLRRRRPRRRAVVRPGGRRRLPVARRGPRNAFTHTRSPSAGPSGPSRSMPRATAQPTWSGTRPGPPPTTVGVRTRRRPHHHDPAGVGELRRGAGRLQRRRPRRSAVVGPLLAASHRWSGQPDGSFVSSPAG